MKPFRAMLVGVSLATAVASCGGSSPLVGRWTASVQPQTGATDSLTLALNADGSMTIALAGTGSCSGALSYSGFSWTSTATSFTAAGAGTCSGAGVTCPGAAGMATCGTTGPMAGTCTYQLSNNNLTLVVSGCDNTIVPGTFTHAM